MRPWSRPMTGSHACICVLPTDHLGEDYAHHGEFRSRARALVVAVGVAGLVAAMGVTASPAGAAPKAAKPYDFDGNGYPDLAIGAPVLRVGSVRRAGGVMVLPSSKKGPSRREKVISESSKGVPGASERDDGFGAAVASADFNRDGFADLAVGSRARRSADESEAGVVTVIYGSRRDSTRAGRSQWAAPGARNGKRGGDNRWRRQISMPTVSRIWLSARHHGGTAWSASCLVVRVD